MLTPVRVTPPAIMPVSWADADAHLRLDGDLGQKALVESLIAAATEHAERSIGQALITQTWRVDAAFWRYPMRLPFGPVQSITSVSYWDAANADTVFAPSNYALHTDALGAAVYLNQGVSWPGVYSREDAIRVTFVAGYGATPADVPAPIRQAILLLVGAWYENREESVIGAWVAGLPRSIAVDALLAPYRRLSL